MSEVTPGDSIRDEELTNEDALVEARTRYPDGVVRHFTTVEQQYAFAFGAAWQRGRRVSPVTREDVRELIAEARKASVAVYLTTGARVADDLSRILRGLADALESASPRAEVEWEEWAQYFERFDSTVGAPKLTGELVAKLLRGPKPFGRSTGSVTPGEGKE